MVDTKLKAKMEWLNFGDKNTTFYHKTIKENRSKALTRPGIDNQGVKREGTEVSNTFTSFFEDLYSTDPSLCVQSDLIDELNFLYSFSEADKVSLCCPIVEEEIKEHSYPCMILRHRVPMATTLFFSSGIGISLGMILPELLNLCLSTT